MSVNQACPVELLEVGRMIANMLEALGAATDTYGCHTKFSSIQLRARVITYLKRYRELFPALGE